MALEKLIKAIQDTGSKYYRLILVLSPFAETNTKLLQEASARYDCPYINFSLLLSGQLLDTPAHKRSAQVVNLLPGLVRNNPGEVILLDHIEVLFLPELRLDPLRALQSISRNKTLVASWVGEYDGKKLTYATQGHPEFQRYQGLTGEDCAFLNN